MTHIPGKMVGEAVRDLMANMSIDGNLLRDGEDWYLIDDATYAYLIEFGSVTVEVSRDEPFLWEVTVNERALEDLKDTPALALLAMLAFGMAMAVFLSEHIAEVTA